jgi:hypothetical protein
MKKSRLSKEPPAGSRSNGLGRKLAIGKVKHHAPGLVMEQRYFHMESGYASDFLARYQPKI